MMQLPRHIQPSRGLVQYNRPVDLPLWTPPQQDPDFFDGLRKIWRHRGLVAACTVGLGAASIGAALLLPSYYVGEARIQVGVPDTPIFASDPRVIDQGGSTDEKVENERLAVQSRGLIKQVAAQMQLADNPEFAGKSGWLQAINPLQYFAKATNLLRSHFVSSGDNTAAADPDTDLAEDRLIDAVLSRIDVSILGRSQVLSVQASAQNPKLAAALANNLAAAYLGSQKNLKTDDANRIEGYLSDRINQLRQQVENSDRAVAEYRKKYGLYQGTNASVSSQELTELNSQMIGAQTAKAEADSRLSEAVAAKQGGDSLPDVLNSPVIQALRAQQAEAERNLAQLSAMYGPRHPKMLDARAAVQEIRARIQAETNRIVEGLRHQAATADARYAAVEKDFGSAKNEAGGVSEQTIELQALEREATVNSNLLEAMLNRAKETMGRAEIDQPDARLISAAAPPLKPSYPPKSMIAVLGTLAGALLGALVALFWENADRTFRRVDELEQLTGLPVISMIPTIKKATPPVAQILRAPASTYGEAIRKIYIGLQLSVKSEPPKTILFSSATPAEGKSVVAASFARMLARSGKRVLLVDCDWRGPTLHRLFHCSNRYGLAQLMSEEDGFARSAIFNDEESGLDVLVAGGWTPESAEMLASDRMAAMLHSFAKTYDVVVLDSAPVLVSAEILILARLVDKTVFLVRWGQTHRESVFDALRQLRDAQADVAGVVLSRVDAKRYREFAATHLNYDYGLSSIDAA